MKSYLSSFTSIPDDSMYLDVKRYCFKTKKEFINERRSGLILGDRFLFSDRLLDVYGCLVRKDSDGIYVYRKCVNSTIIETYISFK